MGLDLVYEWEQAHNKTWWRHREHWNNDLGHNWEVLNMDNATWYCPCSSKMFPQRHMWGSGSELFSHLSIISVISSLNSKVATPQFLKERYFQWIKSPDSCSFPVLATAISSNAPYWLHLLAGSRQARMAVIALLVQKGHYDKPVRAGSASKWWFIPNGFM